MLNNGSIVEVGTYEELKRLNGQFTHFIKTYLENQEQSADRMNNIIYRTKNFLSLFSEFYRNRI